MVRLVGLAASCCFILVAKAAGFKWSAKHGARGWAPARETLGVMPLLGANPMATSPPKLGEARGYKRAGEDNTCAYVNGDPGSSVNGPCLSTSDGENQARLTQDKRNPPVL
jgi:hypothetical protein